MSLDRCIVRVDKLGNIFARPADRDPNLPPVMTGSHLDTQPTGGKFDGADVARPWVKMRPLDLRSLSNVRMSRS